VSVSPECYLLSLTHDARASDFAAVPGPVVIGDRAWLGARAMVLPGVSMGEGSVAGAGAIVARSCGPYEIVAGAPARKIGERNRQLDYTLRYFPLFDTDVQI
jgi:acetyltransferase-like isoleucine patch superfamily enzyme